MGLHEELDPQPEPTGCQIIHLLADAVPQIQPQVFSFAACELQPKVVYFDYAQLSANLKKGKTSGGGGHKKQTKWDVKLFTTGQWQMVKSSFKEAIDNFSCHVESDENQLSKVPLDFFFFLHKEIHQYCCYCRYANTADTPTPHQYSEAHEVNLEPLPGYRGSSSPQSHAPPAAAAMGLLHNCCWKSAQRARRLR